MHQCTGDNGEWIVQLGDVGVAMDGAAGIDQGSTAEMMDEFGQPLARCGPTDGADGVSGVVKADGCHD